MNLPIQQRFNRIATDYDKAAVLTDQASEQLLARLKQLPIQPQTIVDLGMGTGHSQMALAKLYPDAAIIGIDFAQAMLRQAKQLQYGKPLICAKAQQLPLAEASVDLIFMNMLLPWCEDLPELLQEIKRVLRPKGVILFSTLGPDTLSELRMSWQQADEYPHINQFTDMHDIGDMLRQYFIDIVIEMENITVRYRYLKSLLRDLQHLGSLNLQADKKRGLTTQRTIDKVQTYYQQHYTCDDKITATFEVIYGCVWQTEFNGPDEVTNVVYLPLPEIKRKKK